MSAKLLYSLSDDNPNLQKQIGCMNGFLHFFDRHHFIKDRSLNNSNSHSVPPGENRQQERANGASKRSKEKHRKVIKETHGDPTESPRVSVSSSTGSTTISSRDYDWATEKGRPAFRVTTYTDRRSLDGRVNQPYSSPYQPATQPNLGPQFNKKHTATDSTSTTPSPIKTAPREQVARHAIKQVDSPRLLQPSKVDSPKLVAPNESFRSVSSNHSAPPIPIRKKDPDQMLKDAPRFSYDSRATRDTYISSLKLRDLPRLSLDSRQRTIKKPACESNEDLVLRDLRTGVQNNSKTQHLLEEPGSYRPPSNIVAKLMGLEALPDCSPSIKSQIELDNSRISDFSLKSTRTIDETKVNRILHSPSSNCREPRTPRLNRAGPVDKPKQTTKVLNEPSLWNQPDGNQEANRGAQKTGSTNQEVNPEAQKHPLTVYGEIEERLNDLDFKRSGKDLRALKQILEAMHAEKTKLGSRKEIRSSDWASETCSNSSSYTSQKQSLRNTACQHLDRSGPMPLSKSPKDIQSKHMKPSRLVRGSRKEAPLDKCDLELPTLHQVRIGQSEDHIKDLGQKKTAIHPTPIAYHFKDQSRQIHHTIDKSCAERTSRPRRTLGSPQHIYNVNITRQAKIIETASTRVYSQFPATTLSSRRKQHKQQAISVCRQTGKLQRKSSVLQHTGDKSSEYSTDSACLSQVNTNLFLSESTSSLVSQMNRVVTSTDQSAINYDTVQQVSNNKSEGIKGDQSPKELTIAVREQPSPVSVLDAKFYGDESPSPVKKKPTAFRDYETDATYTGTEWKDNYLTWSPDSTKPSFSYESDDQELENLKQSTQTLWQLYSHPDRNVSSAKHLLKAVNLEKAYVSEILATSEFLGSLNLNAVTHHVHQSQETIYPRLLFVLEQTKRSRFISEKRSASEANTITKANDIHQQRLLFDTVNEILSQKLSSTCFASQAQLFLKRSLVPRPGGSQILHDIFEEIDEFQANSLNQCLDDEDHFLTTIIGKDLTRGSGNWTDGTNEIPGLVLDIERLIFKDLIVELVRD